jgi:4-amino-4-deoxychorismate lyase
MEFPPTPPSGWLAACGILPFNEVTASLKCVMSFLLMEIERPRCVGLHLDRLERSANAIDLPLPPRRDLEQWIRDAAVEGGGDDGMIRCIITRGGGSQGYGHHLGEDLCSPSSTFILWQPLPSQPESYRLLPMCVPWHSGGVDTDNWAAVKWLSYGPNVHSTRLAQKQGYDDALLLAARGQHDDEDASISKGVVLDGPNWALAWTRNDGTFCTPSWKDLGLLQSTSCTIALEAVRRMGMPVEEGIYRLEELERHATALWVMSTTRDLIPVVSLGTTAFSTDSTLRDKLLRAMDAVVHEHD